MNERNVDLEALIVEAGTSRAGLAARVNVLGSNSGKTYRYDHTSVGRWIRGERPREPVPDLIRAVLSEQLGRPLTLTDVGLATTNNDAAPEALSSYLDRTVARWRSHAREPSARAQEPPLSRTAAQLPIWEWENLPGDTTAARDGAGRLGLHDVRTVIAARGRYEEMYRQVGGVATGTRVRSFLANHAAIMLQARYSDAVGRQLLRALGGLVAVAGICAYDSDSQRAAQTYYHQALRFAKASGDRQFGAYVMTLLVTQAIQGSDHRSAVAFATVGLRVAGTSISPALSTDLHLQRAKAYAALGEATDARRDIRRAERAHDRIRVDEEPPETSYVQPGLLETQIGAALLSLRDLPAAMTFAEAAASTTTHPRGNVNRLVTVTMISMARGDLDRAAIAASAMLDTARGMESGRLSQRFRTIRALMARHRSSNALRDVTERLDLELAIPS